MAFPSALPLAARAAVGLGTLAYQAFRSRNSTSASSTNMAAPAPAVRRVGGRRVLMRRRRTPMQLYRRPREYSVRHRRVASQILFQLAGGEYRNIYDINMGQLYLDDIRNAYDMYRITKVTAEVVPQHDPGNGISGEITTYSVWTANDTRGTFIPASWSNGRELSQFENYKYQSIKSGRAAYYTFYPKVTNLVSDTGGGTAAAGNYETNPWISFSNITVPHHRLLLDIRSPSATCVEFFVLTFTIHFECRRAR